MKYLLQILLFFPILVRGQFAVGWWLKPSYISSGEYFPAGYDSANHQAYHTLNIIPQPFTGQPAYVGQVWGGPHDCALTDTLGSPYFSGGNPAGEDGLGTTAGTCGGCMVQVKTDSAGRPLPPVVQILLSGNNNPAYWFNAIVTSAASGGKVGLAGNLQGGLRGNGTAGSAAQSKFVWVLMPHGDTIVKIQGLYNIVALNTLGQVLTWGDNNYAYALGQGNSPVANAPGYVPLPAGWRAYDIGSAGIFSWILADSAGHHKQFSFGWQYDPGYQGLGPSGTVKTSPTDVTGLLNFPSYPVHVYTNNESTYFILADGSLWALGGNACGTIGNGLEINYATYKTPYAWDQGQNEFMQYTPYNVAPGVHDWVNVYTGYSNCWYVYAQRANGALYGWGRNKSGAIWNGVIDGAYINGNLAAARPNSWDLPWPTLITWPGSPVHLQQTTSPICLSAPTTQFCNLYPNPVAPPPSCSANSSLTPIAAGATYILTGSASAAAGYFINSTVWTQLSGPSTATIQFPGVITSLVFGLLPGTYTFQLTATDNNLRTASSTVILTVGCQCLNLTAFKQQKDNHAKKDFRRHVSGAALMGMLTEPLFANDVYGCPRPRRRYSYFGRGLDRGQWLWLDHV